MEKYVITLSLVFVFCFAQAQAQAQAPDSVYWIKQLPEVEIKHRPLTDAERKEYRQMVYNVRRTYPYARMAAERFKKYEDTLAMMPKGKDRKRFIKRVENEIRDEFLEDLKSMTVSQGKVLFKLMGRLSGESSYNMVKTLKSGAAAFGFQFVGRFFGYNLKEEYDPSGEDLMLEVVVSQLERGVFSEISPKKKTSISPNSKGDRSVYFVEPDLNKEGKKHPKSEKK